MQMFVFDETEKGGTSEQKIKVSEETMMFSSLTLRLRFVKRVDKKIERRSILTMTSQTWRSFSNLRGFR